MAFLITGGASQIGTVVARLLKEAGKKVIIASRSGSVPDGYESVKFDWTDESTLDAPFTRGEPIQGVYIMVPPGFFDPSENIIAFIDKAVAHGVKRFVVLAGSAIEKHHDAAKVWRYLDDKQLDYFVLRPTAFMENFHKFDGPSIRERNEFTTVIPTAKVPFVSAEDIGRVAFKALTSEKNDRTDQYVVGPELLTYDQVADILSEVLGRKITHKTITGEQMTKVYTDILGWAPAISEHIVKAQLDMEAGSAERLFSNPDSAVGKVTFREWAEKHKDKLAPAS
ncbi:hypothetical protein NMY22_g524 [Coprinellus aureogranulatus]|nr:hypothetical protein NMY22_g524 [Coprinellus aureogranulatus]